MKIYLVGGAVRNHLMDWPIKDLDFAVEAESFTEMQEQLALRGFAEYLTKPEFVSVRGSMLWKDLPAAFRKIVPEHKLFAADFTMCRKETMYSDNRHPDTVTPADILTDLSRRDFTMNAVAIDEDGKFIDPHEGVLDATTGWLRCVGDARERFIEDPLRMLRALRFLSLYDMSIDIEIEKAYNDTGIVRLLQTIPTERVYDELKPMFKHDPWHAFHIVTWYPEIARAISTHHSRLWFKPTMEAR